MQRPNVNYDPRANGCRCDECPLKGKRVVPPEGTSSPIVIVGDAPGKQEEAAQRPYAGPVGFKLQELLRRAGMPPRSDLLITNALLCRPEIPTEFGKKRFDLKQYLAWLRKQNVQLKKLKQPLIKSPFECCRPRLKKELREAEARARQLNAQDPTQFPNGAVVMPTGNFALAELMGIQKRAMKVLSYRGSVMTPHKGVLSDE